MRATIELGTIAADSPFVTLLNRILLTAATACLTSRIAAAQTADLKANASQRLDAPPTAVGALDMVNGLYPLWEHTGVVHNSGSGQIGYQYAQFAVGPVQLSTQPFLDLYGTLNVQGKLSVFRSDRIKLALVAGVYRIPTGAEGRMLGHLNPTGFVNPYDTVYVAPLSFAKSVLIRPHVALHWASTLLVSYGSEAGSRSLAAGQAFIVEAIASPRWRARVHTGIEGLNVEGKGHAGLSFAYQGDVVRLAAGAGQQMTFTGQHSTFMMFDGALVF